jgi:carbon monoxide dehydrogenase subunit G
LRRRSARTGNASQRRGPTVVPYRLSAGGRRLSDSRVDDARGGVGEATFRDVIDRLAHRACRHVPTVGGCQSEEVEFMTSATVKRVFEVDAPLEEAWQRLAEVERWPEWAPHITSVTVSPPGELGPTSSGALQIKRLGRNTFRMSVWEPPVRWEWVGGLVGVRIFYDHRFESSGPAATRLEWLVELHGPLAPLIRAVFARVYGRNLDRAIPRLQEWFRR